MSKDVDQLFAEIKDAVQKRAFSKAEILREQLIELNPTALTEIIGAAELIENEKTLGLEKEHLAIWENLYQGLNEEETNCLFYSLKKVVVPAKKIILSQGGYNTRLYFIERGKVTVVNQKKGKNEVITQLGVGALLGEYTFSMISLCSATVVSGTEVHLRYLENSATDRWHHDFPGLYEKITAFCANYGKINAIESRQTEEDEKLEVISVDGKAIVSILSKTGNKTDTCFRGGLPEIHSHGCCIEFKSSKRETARALLGKNLHLALYFNREDEKPSLSVIGKVIRVTFQYFNDYSAYISFEESISDASLPQHPS